MNIVSGSRYPLTLNLTRNGKPSSLPSGATVEWIVSNPELGTVTADAVDPTLGTIEGGTVGATGTVTAKVSFTGADGEAKEVDAPSGDLTVVAGEPDAGSVEVGAELP